MVYYCTKAFSGVRVTNLIFLFSFDGLCYLNTTERLEPNHLGSSNKPVLSPENPMGHRRLVDLDQSQPRSCRWGTRCLVGGC